MTTRRRICRSLKFYVVWREDTRCFASETPFSYAASLCLLCVFATRRQAQRCARVLNYAGINGDDLVRMNYVFDFTVQEWRRQRRAALAWRMANVH